MGTAMTKGKLKEYRSNLDEIKELRYKLEHLDDGDSMIGNDVIFDYQTGFPRARSVVGFDKKKYERRKQAYQKRIRRLTEECEEVEAWIEAIPDGMVRRIFRMTYIEGMTQQKVARKMHLDQSAVSKKISNFLQME